MNKPDLQQRTPPESGPISPRLELILLLCGMVAFFLLNWFTAEKTPAVWCDEVMYQDPGVNLYQGRGFTSGAWWLQTRDKFWAGNVPLYQLGVFAWLKIFGFNLTSVRCFHYFLAAAAVFVAWLAIRRLDLVRSPAHRLLFCLVACLCTSVAFVYRSARPESLALLLAACALLSLSFKPRWLALVSLALCGLLLFLTGLQMAAYLAVMAALVLVCGPRRLFPEMAALCAGCALGLGLVYLLYSSHGVWNDFVDCVRHHTVANKGTHFEGTHPYGSGFSQKIKQVPQLFLDYSFVPVLALAAWVGWSLARAGALRRSSPLRFGIIACIVVPLALHIVGIFPMYYFWMAFFPLAIGLFAELGPWLALHRGTFARRAMAGLLLLACLLGLPRRLVVAAFEWKARSYDPVMKMAAPYVARDRVVVSEFAAYYAAKQFGAEVLLPDHLPLLSPKDDAQVSVAILHNGDVASLSSQYGGVWQDTGAAVNPPLPKRWLRENLDSRQYELRVFVRKSASDIAGKPNGLSR